MRSPGTGPAATIGMSIAYLLATLSVLPQLYFFPRPGTWSLHAVQGEPAIRWYGAILWSLLGGLLAGGLAEVTGARVPWRLALLVPILTLVGLAVAQYSWFGF